MIKELHEKFKGMTIDFKCILKEDNIIVFMMPVIENGKKISALKFEGTPDVIDEEIRTSILEMGSNVVKSVADYESFLNSIEKAKQDTVKKPKKKEVAKVIEEKKTQPSLF